MNLTLDIVDRRDDGYHSICSIMQTLQLHDRVTVSMALEPGISLRCVTPFGEPVDLPIGVGNLAWKAAQTLFDASGAKGNPAVHIEIEKAIPIAAGLAGGSADAAAVLSALNEIWELHWDAGRLAQVGLRLGADVPFCLMGGTALAQGIGEQLQKLPEAPPLGVVLVKPPFGISAADAYRMFDEALAQGRIEKEDRPGQNAMLQALESGDPSSIAAQLKNVFERPVFVACPELAVWKQALLEFGALDAAMSGSGPTLFGITATESDADEVARRLAIGSAHDNGVGVEPTERFMPGGRLYSVSDTVIVATRLRGREPQGGCGI